MTKSSDGGKGSSPRPFSVAQAEYEARWDMIFSRDNDVGRDKPKEKEETTEEQPKEEQQK